MAKDFLNSGILGGGAGVADKSGFRAIRTDYIGSPEYNPRFFETFPTAWASAYAFRKALENKEDAAVEEWATLFLLYYFGIVHLKEFDQKTLQSDYGRDLWLAFHGTYPRVSGEPDLQTIGILLTDHQTVVGAYYPQVVFFPSRGRDAWEASESLKPYLNNNRLSWEKCAPLLEDEYDRQRFHLYLRSMTRILARKELKDRIEEFCNQKFGAFFGELSNLPNHPRDHDIPGKREIDLNNLLSAYPLRKEKKNGGNVYYLLNELDLNNQLPWMKTAISSGLPAPSNYLRVNDRQISVRFAGKVHTLDIDERDEIVLLKDLFLSHSPFWCKISGSLTDFVTRTNIKHEVNLQDGSLRQGDKALCLAPVKSDFLKHFSDIFRDLKNIKSEPDANGGVTWTFFICGNEVRCYTKPVHQANMPNSSLAVYPPQFSQQWKFYAGYGTGNRETCGRWHLIDENGRRGQMIELEEEEYISVLHSFLDEKADVEPNAPNRPRAMLFTDAADKERGVLFLSEINNIDLDKDQKATLAVDFGTSNTCLAVNAGQSETLKFSLSPLPLWGEPPKLEQPGFVPRNWSGGKGFFPTILLTRKSDDSLPNIEPEKLQLEHLFKADVPCLHDQMSGRLIAGTYDSEWRVHENLKWDADLRTPWRSLFLQTILLYAHAEVFFNKRSKLNKYVFTYPLAFSDDYGSTYHEKAKDAIKQVRHYCFGDDRQSDAEFKYLRMDESTAIAKSLKQTGLNGLLEVFVDIGGGTADIAVRHQDKYLVLDSLKVAGKSFFNITKKTLDDTELVGSGQLRNHLKQLLGRDPKGENIKIKLPLGALYSVQINELDDSVFKAREESILKQGMGARSFQRYRAQLFFSHILGYALMQAVATAVSQKIMIHNGIKIILGGNGWGLLLFAEWKRSSTLLQTEANGILQLLKANLREVVTEDELEFLEKVHLSGVELLNETNLSRAKNSVALGALQAIEEIYTLENTEPFAGFTVADFQIDGGDPRTIRWCERWSFDSFQDIFGRMRQINSIAFHQPDNLNLPIDKNLAIFTGLGNASHIGEDNLPASTWQKINGGLGDGIRRTEVNGNKLVVPNPMKASEFHSAAPLNYFLSEILYPADDHNDFLTDLAKANGNLYNS